VVSTARQRSRRQPTGATTTRCRQTRAQWRVCVEYAAQRKSGRLAPSPVGPLSRSVCVRLWRTRHGRRGRSAVAHRGNHRSAQGTHLTMSLLSIAALPWQDTERATTPRSYRVSIILLTAVSCGSAQVAPHHRTQEGNTTWLRHHYVNPPPCLQCRAYGTGSAASFLCVCACWRVVACAASCVQHPSRRMV